MRLPGAGSANAGTGAGSATRGTARWRAYGLAAGAVIAALAAALAYANGHGAAGAAKALLAAVIAVGVAAFAVTLPGINLRGTVIGGLFVLAGFMTWTYTTRPLVIWAVLGVAGVIMAVWSWPWLADLRSLPRLGTAWLGLAYWFLGIVGAVLSVHLKVAGQRVAYAGVFTLAALAVVATVRRARESRGRTGDPSVGMAASIFVGIALLLLAGSATLFDSIHAIPNQDPSTVLMRDRFWGGPGLYFHPNSMAGLAITAAIRIAPDRRFAAWQRLVAVVVAGFVLYESNSRIGFIFFAAAALVHVALLVLRRWSTDRVPEDLPRYRRAWLAALVPFLMLALVLVLSGGRGFLTQSRFGGDDMSSGRLDTWRQVYHDWQGDGLPEKIFGNAKTSRAVVVRATSDRQLNTDNAAVGAFRRGGVLGIIAFLFGLLLLLWHALRPVLRRGPPRSGAAWFVVAALAAVPTIATEDWLLGGTNGAIWLILMAGEAVALWAAATSVPQIPSQPSPSETATQVSAR
jgi:hypothetical protein